MNKERIKKLESLSLEIISQIIFEEALDIQNDFWLINVTDVTISPDLSYLDVWVSCIKNGEMLPKALAKKNYIIQWQYNRKMSIRKLPKIRYRYDARGENSAKILDTLQQIRTNEKID